MKTPLRFQVTEYDCGTISLLNAFSYLFHRKEIPITLVKAIHQYTLDCYDSQGILGGGGTSREATSKLTNWITDYANNNSFGVELTRLEGTEINLEKIKQCVDNKGCVFLRCWQNTEHYVIVTKLDKKYAYIFDCYYLPKNEYKNDSDVRIILSKPFEYNRKIKLKRLFKETKEDFALGEVSKRECVLINRKKEQ